MSQFDTNLDENMYMDAAESSFVEDRTDGYVDPKVGNIVRLVEDKFSKAETSRLADETR